MKAAATEHLKDAAPLPTQPAHGKAFDLVCIGQDQHGLLKSMQGRRRDLQEQRYACELSC